MTQYLSQFQNNVLLKHFFSPLNLLFKRQEHECSFYSETEIRRATSAIRVTYTFEVRWKACCDGSYILLEVKIGPLLHFLLRPYLAIGLPSMYMRLNYSLLWLLSQSDKYFNFIQWYLCSLWESYFYRRRGWNF